MTQTTHPIAYAWVTTLVLGLFFACGGGTVYELPPPPSDAEVATVALDPAEAAELSEANYQQARRVVLEVYEAIGAEAWDDVYARVSLETRLLFDTFGAHPEGGQNIGDGTFVVDGATYLFDPATILLPANPSGFSDTHASIEEHESTYRKDIFITTMAGDTVRVVCIEEGGQWLIHMPEIPMSQLQDPPPPSG